MARYDVIVLGGGIIGAAMAEELARHGQRVTVIERGTIGSEASSAAAGILSAQMDLPSPGPLFELAHAARRMYPRWVEHLERRTHQSVGYHVDGILYLAMSGREESAMKRQARWQATRGLPVERWSPKEVRRHEPAVDGRFRCGFHFPTEAQVDNVALMRVLALACRKAGVVLQERTAARRLLIHPAGGHGRGGKGFDRVGGMLPHMGPGSLGTAPPLSRVGLRKQKVRGVETDHGTVEAPCVVNCLGSWAAMGGTFPLPVPVEPARGQMLAFRGPKRLLRHAVMSERAYAVQRRDGRLLVGSTVEFVGFEKTLTLEGIHTILSGLRHMTSALNCCTFLEAWAGFRPCTSDKLPIMGATPIEGLYVATGHFRHGILLAPITAHLMAELILTGRASFDLAPFAPQRFST